LHGAALAGRIGVGSFKDFGEVIMKARLVPLYFAVRDKEFYGQVERLKSLLAGEAEILEPVALGALLPEAEAVVFPQLLGEAYRQVKDFKAIKLPVLIIT
jgi:hypothetical protein